MRLLVNTALMWLAFLINAQQNTNQKSIGSVSAYQAQGTQPIYRTLFQFLKGLVLRLSSP